MGSSGPGYLQSQDDAHGLRSARGLGEAFAGSPPPELMRRLPQSVRSLSLWRVASHATGHGFGGSGPRRGLENRCCHLQKTHPGLLPLRCVDACHQECTACNRGAGPPNERPRGPKIDRRKHLGTGSLTHRFCDRGRRSPSDQHPPRSRARHCLATRPSSCTANSRANRPACWTMTVRTPFPRP